MSSLLNCAHITCCRSRDLETVRQCIFYINRNSYRHIPIYHCFSGQFNRDLDEQILHAKDRIRCTKVDPELLSSECVLHLPDSTAKCPKSIMEKVDKQFILPKKFPWTAAQPPRHPQISQSPGWVQPFTKMVPKCVLLWRSSFHFSSSLGLCYNPN